MTTKYPGMRQECLICLKLRIGKGFTIITTTTTAAARQMRQKSLTLLSKCQGLGKLSDFVRLAKHPLSPLVKLALEDNNHLQCKVEIIKPSCKQIMCIGFKDLRVRGSKLLNFNKGTKATSSGKGRITLTELTPYNSTKSTSSLTKIPRMRIHQKEKLTYYLATNISAVDANC
uniref:Uncharacterized protein n=1 Tax=Glossina austeni TaxID=7395 RepID=A0A1A9V8P5_GLOAU